MKTFGTAESNLPIVVYNKMLYPSLFFTNIQNFLFCFAHFILFQLEIQLIYTTIFLSVRNKGIRFTGIVKDGTVQTSSVLSFQYTT